MENTDPFTKIESGTNKGSKILKRVFFTSTEMLIYPGGKIYPNKTISWFKDKVYTPKPKKKKTVAKESTLTSEESY